MNYIIFDLEATCWEGPQPAPNEIIEIGALAINEQQQITGEFQTFVKPFKSPVLSDFCKELTSIQQAEVDNAPTFDVALGDFQQWINLEAPYWLCSWGFYDRKQLRSDCQAYGLATDWLKPHISLKHQYEKIGNSRRKIGMKAALQQEGFALDGTHHRGIDDARNIAKIFLKYFGEWSH